MAGKVNGQKANTKGEMGRTGTEENEGNEEPPGLSSFPLRPSVQLPGAAAPGRGGAEELFNTGQIQHNPLNCRGSGVE
jgi:hypothetical protein